MFDRATNQQNEDVVGKYSAGGEDRWYCFKFS